MREAWIPEDIDVTTASVARMYDYYLGGGHNLEVDRAAARQAIAIMPRIVDIARANRAFVRRAVRACLAAGVRQFLDLGSGIPTVGHVHEIAHRIDRTARVAYVDTDPITVAHAGFLLAGLPTTTITCADMTDPAAVLSAPGVRDLLDLTQPIAVIAAAVLHVVPDDCDPRGILQAYRAVAAAGSMLVFSHGAPARPISELYRRTGDPGRDEAEIRALLGEWRLLSPGLVDTHAWRPDHPNGVAPERIHMWAAVATA